MFNADAAKDCPDWPFLRGRNIFVKPFFVFGFFFYTADQMCHISFVDVNDAYRLPCIGEVINKQGHMESHIPVPSKFIALLKGTLKCTLGAKSGSPFTFI